MKKKGNERAQARKQERDETTQQRVERLYDSDGGPLIAWLIDEARARGLGMNDMAKALNVTYGYITQLRNGVRQQSCIGQEFAEACARFLGVPTIVVKLLSGRIRISDFAWSNEGEQAVIERAYRFMKTDPVARQHLPKDDCSMTYEAMRSLVMLYGETTGVDVLSLRQLSWVLQYLQRPAMIHNDNEVEAALRRGDIQPELNLMD